MVSDPQKERWARDSRLCIAYTGTCSCWFLPCSISSGTFRLWISYSGNSHLRWLPLFFDVGKKPEQECLSPCHNCYQKFHTLRQYSNDFWKGYMLRSVTDWFSLLASFAHQQFETFWWKNNSPCYAQNEKKTRLSIAMFLMPWKNCAKVRL